MPGLFDFNGALAPPRRIVSRDFGASCYRLHPPKVKNSSPTVANGFIFKGNLNFLVL